MKKCVYISLINQEYKITSFNILEIDKFYFSLEILYYNFFYVFVARPLF